MKPHMSAFLIGFHLFRLLPLSSESISINGTKGAPWLWSCQHTLSGPFDHTKSLIYWQSQDSSPIVVHAYVKGKQEFQHQNSSFENRTKIFPDQLPFGNFSLIITNLTLKDDQISLKVFFMPGNNPSKVHLCPVTLYVAVPFQEPKIEINQNKMIASCRTAGGYPKPDVTWSDGHGRTLEAHKVHTTITPEKDNNFNVSSTTNITGSNNVTCTIYNPTSNQILSATKDITPPTANIHFAAALPLAVLGAMAILCFIYIRRNQRHVQREEESSASGKSC
ncbi:CD276 antigen homolog isoform X2 [Toxotes jaculatrix]|uniref:CD276 antigen homolog isoform X2 n=1 Tax=Toxotes jaculatrix TaxID=941984 RepID=UPI001B3A8E4E|nr:CD276 antigen homolog isoform X2 [Toxotes jaculatrix]